MSEIAVVGGTGFVGRVLVGRLAAAGHRVRVLSRRLDAHPDARLAPASRFVEVDPYDAAALTRALTGSEVVINLVGILNERGRDGRGFAHAHVELTRTVIGAMRSAGVRRLVQMSALNAGRGRSHYLRTRGEAEALVRESGLVWSIVRPSVIFGPGDGLFTRFAGLLKLAPVMPLARANARFAPVYVGDVAQAIVALLARRDSVGQTYELGGPEVFTLAEIVRYTAREMELRRVVVPIPDFLGRFQGAFFDFVPGKPFSTDNFLSLLVDSVPEHDGFEALGLPKTPIAAVVPAMLSLPARHARLDHARRAARR